MINSKIIKEFERLIKHESNKAYSSKNRKNVFRIGKLRNSLQIIKDYPKVIKSGEQLKEIKGIGKGTIKRIDEIINNGYLSEITTNPEEKYMKKIVELEKVFGIGRRTAYELVVKHKIKSVDDLKKKYEKKKIELSRHIVLGLKYYKDYKEVIPREQIDIINKYLQKAVKKIDKNLCIVICGSYRRGKPYSNDIDILLSHKKIKTKAQMMEKNYLHNLVDILKLQELIIDDIDVNYNVKYMGFIKYKTFPIMHLDILYVPYNSLGPALLHFTGPWELNKKMRNIALLKGYKLNQYRLCDQTTGENISTPTEKSIFKKLGMEYMEPIDRI